MASTQVTSSGTGENVVIDQQAELKASRARKREYVQKLERAIHVLTTEKLELQMKVATLTNQLWEQSVRVDELEKQMSS
jgi:hypothetical protein